MVTECLRKEINAEDFLPEPNKGTFIQFLNSELQDIFGSNFDELSNQSQLQVKYSFIDTLGKVLLLTVLRRLRQLDLESVVSDQQLPEAVRRFRDDLFIAFASISPKKYNAVLFADNLLKTLPDDIAFYDVMMNEKILAIYTIYERHNIQNGRSALDLTELDSGITTKLVDFVALKFKTIVLEVLKKCEASEQALLNDEIEAIFSQLDKKIDEGRKHPHEVILAIITLIKASPESDQLTNLIEQQLKTQFSNQELTLDLLKEQCEQPVKLLTLLIEGAKQFQVSSDAALLSQHGIFKQDSTQSTEDILPLPKRTNDL